MIRKILSHYSRLW